jgi:hypothetical protein
MKLALVSVMFGSMLCMGGVAEAASWSRSGSVTTARGVYSRSVTGNCYGGSCARSATTTRPYGGTVSRTGSATRTGPYGFAFSRTTSGPNGRSVMRRGFIRRYPY